MKARPASPKPSAQDAGAATGTAALHLDLVDAPARAARGSTGRSGASDNGAAFAVRDQRLRKGLDAFAGEVLRGGSETLTVRTAQGPRTLRVHAVPGEAEAETPPTVNTHPDVAAAIDRARARGALSAAEILDGPDMLRGAEIAVRMGMTRQAVHKAAAGGRLLALTGGSRDVRYPAWQLDETGARLEGLPEVIAALGPGWPSYRFLVSADASGLTAWQRMAAGETSAVLFEARAWARGDYG